MSYYTDRLKALQITPEKNKIKAEFPGEARTADCQYFTEDKDGNIIIHYFNVRGEVETYTKGRKLVEFTRTRRNPATNPPAKYTQPTGSATHVFCTPGIIAKYKECIKASPEQRPIVKDLYITEGEFKAFALDNNGVLCFGLGGINSFKDERKTRLNDDIIDFIKVCRVENVFMLYDADCFKCEWEENKDLKTRAATFAASVKGFSEALKPYGVNFYMCHIHEKFSQSFKGIDDLLYSNEDTQKILNELQRYSEGTNAKSGVTDREYIITYLISKQSIYFIDCIFATNTPQDFFNKHQKELINKDWKFGGLVYYADENNKVHERREENKRPSNYIMVGDDFYIYTYKQRGEAMITELEKIKKSTIIIDMPKKEAERFISKIPKYDIFTYEPENDPGKYKKTIVNHDKDQDIRTRAYNEYEKVNHTATPGEFPNIDKLLHHIFDYQNLKGEPLYNFVLDYLKLLYTNPTQKLPVLCLVSKENATGKTTFLDLLQLIFGGNMIVTSSTDLGSEFNSLWAGRFIVAIDEAEIPTDKKEVSNVIKTICTNRTVTKQGKGRDSIVINNYSHLIMCSNHEDNFVKLTKEDNRFCIIKVKTIQGERDSELLEKMKNEIPAFLYFLKTRDFTYPKKERTYFDFDLYKTPQLNKVIEANQDPVEVAIHEVLLKQYFIKKIDTVEVSTLLLKTEADKYLNFKIDTKRIKKYFSDRELTELNTVREFEYIKDVQGVEIPEIIRGRRWVIPCEKVLTDEEIKELKNEIMYNTTPRQEQKELVFEDDKFAY